MKKWEIIKEFKINPPGGSEFRTEELVKLLLENRGITTKKEREAFVNPKLENVTVASVEIDTTQLKKAVKRIQKAIEKKEKIIVFGDYDVDGICGAAILWETLYLLKASVLPYIPNRIEEGYGLSTKGIENLLTTMPDVSLIITVDNGIVANNAVDFANERGIDIIITDHHVPSSTPPKAHAIVHTTMLCGAGVGWMLAQQFGVTDEELNHLELVALATIADLVPLSGANRILAKFGLMMLAKTQRLGHLELFKEAALDPAVIGVYEVGHVIAPRLNAMGRLESALDSLRLICTKDPKRAAQLALKLGQTNRERQRVTEELTLHAKEAARNEGLSKKLLFISHDSYQQGVIGLIAGRLVEEFYRPSIVVSVGDIYSKASARSVRGFNIIEFIRGASDLLVDAGGHPMAAGFTVETSKLALLQETLEKRAEELVLVDHLIRNLRIDCELPFSFISETVYAAIQKLAPFGMGNPEPTFVTRNVIVADMRLVGKEGKHLKLRFEESGKTFDAIAFGMGERAKEIRIGDNIDVVYIIEEEKWNGNKKLQLKIKDIMKPPKDQ